MSKLEEVVSQLFIMASRGTAASKMSLCKVIHNCVRAFFVDSPQAQNEIFSFGPQVLHLSSQRACSHLFVFMFILYSALQSTSLYKKKRENVSLVAFSAPLLETLTRVVSRSSTPSEGAS